MKNQTYLCKTIGNWCGSAPELFGIYKTMSKSYNNSKSVLNPHNYRSVYFLLNWLPFLILLYFDRISIGNK